MEIQKMDTYKTSDLYLSAFLIARGMKLRDTVSNGRKTLFVFDDTNERERLLEAFFNDGLVSAKAFKGALQDLKTIIFNT